MFRLLLIAVLLGLARAATQDKTRQPGASGAEVVKAVVSLIRGSCVFPDDKLFLRRLAYVETKDGTDSSLYRPGYNGGIWNINEGRLNQLKTNSKAIQLFNGIQTNFAIDWNSVSWSDLRKPLYSGIAAALHQATVTEEVPRQLEKQASYYAKYFHVGPNSAHNYYVEASKIKEVCQRTKLDLAFLVDGSTSLSSEDFANAKDFVRYVVDDFKIGPDDVRVAFVTFSSGYKSHFDFSTYTDKDSLEKAIDNIKKPEGARETNLALDFATDALFTASHGSRDGTAKVILILTNGKSSNHLRTVPAALRAKRKGIIIYSIGVGAGVDKQELTDMASSPQCTHVIQLAGYSDLSALLNELQQVSCQTPAVLGPGSYTFNCADGGLFAFQTNGANETVTFSVTDGVVNINGSLQNPNPSQSLNSFSSTSSTQAKSVIQITSGYKPVYVTVRSPGPPNGCKGKFTVNVRKIHRVPPVTYVDYVDHDRATSVANIYIFLYQTLSSTYPFPNPCQPGTPKYMPYPQDQTRYLFCDRQGHVYVIQCAPHHIYLDDIYDCVPREPFSTSTMIVTPSRGPYGNPCTEENRRLGKFFFPYPPDETKYIDCTNWQTLGYIKDCEKGKIWDQIDLTCIDPTEKTFNKHVPNPCANSVRDGDLFAHPTDPHKFIHCDAHGDAYEKDCPNKLVWRQKLLQCIPNGFLNG